MKSYLIELAKAKGIKMDPDSLHGNKIQSPISSSANDNCTIYVPDVGIVI